MKENNEPHAKALSLGDLKIGDKIVVLHLVGGVIQLDDSNDVLTKALTVEKTNYAEQTLTYHGFDLKPIVEPLGKLGIPVLESSGQWSSEVCVVRLGRARKLIYKHVNDKRDAARAASAARPPIDWTFPSKQLIGLLT